ncbi:hypothetical protein ACJ41O_000318 [Fusarium nematophilum]
MTGIKTVSGRQIFTYSCYSVGFTYRLFDFAGTIGTTTETDDEGWLTTIVTTRPVTTATAEETGDGITWDELTGLESDSTLPAGAGISGTQEPGGTQLQLSMSSLVVSVTSEAASSGGGPEAPFGAIVGGVIGGVALMAFVAFALWHVRFQRRRAAAAGCAQGGAAFGGSPWQNFVVLEDRSIPNAVKLGSPLSPGELSAARG